MLFAENATSTLFQFRVVGPETGSAASTTGVPFASYKFDRRRICSRSVFFYRLFVSLPRSKNQNLLEARTENPSISQRRANAPPRCRSFNFTRCYVFSRIKRDSVAFFAVAVNLQWRRRTRVCSRRLGFLKRFSPSAVVAHFAKPSLASIVLPPIVWHYGWRCFFVASGRG